MGVRKREALRVRGETGLVGVMARRCAVDRAVRPVVGMEAWGAEGVTALRVVGMEAWGAAAVMEHPRVGGAMARRRGVDAGSIRDRIAAIVRTATAGRQGTAGTKAAIARGDEAVRVRTMRSGSGRKRDGPRATIDRHSGLSVRS
jgi:hypothetical protein